MATKSKSQVRPSSRSEDPPSHTSLFGFKNPKAAFALALLLADATLVSLVIAYVPYTKIDWDAYMSQVSGFLGGERDYSNLKGDTGPLVYPAGFLYVYSFLQYVTGGEVYPAQVLFGILYIINLGIILFIYVKTDLLPWWALSLLCLSKRVHSIFMLRLFNDCVAMTLLHAAVVALLFQKWHLGLVIFSGAVSIKMNVLLFAPPLFLLMLKAMDVFSVISALACAALVQENGRLPLIWSFIDSFDGSVSSLPTAKKTDFNIVKSLKTESVNFKFVAESVFVSKGFALSLLIVHLLLLGLFAHYRWCKHEGGLPNFLLSKFEFLRFKHALSSSFPLEKSHDGSSRMKILNKKYIVSTLFAGNFIGIVCARSLHYQFYSWYFFSLPYLLWSTPFPTLLRIVLFLGVELCWNIYPSNLYSSVTLLVLHLLILLGLWHGPPEYPYETSRSSTREKRK